MPSPQQLLACIAARMCMLDLYTKLMCNIFDDLLGTCVCCCYFRATHVQNEDGSVVLLSAINPQQRNAIAKRLLTPSKEGSLGGASKKVCLLKLGTHAHEG